MIYKKPIIVDYVSRNKHNYSKCLNVRVRVHVQ